MRNRELLIIDDQHFELVRSFVFFYQQIDDINISIITNVNISNRIIDICKNEKFKTPKIIYTKGNSIFSTLLELNQEFDKIIFSTLYFEFKEIYNLISLDQKFRNSQLYFVGHNLNYLFQKKGWIVKRYRSENQKYFYLLLKKISAFIVLSDSLFDFKILKNSFKELKVISFPFNISTEENIGLRNKYTPNTTEVKLTIPGSVQEKRKDYFSIIPILKKLSLSYSVTLKLLGNAKSEYAQSFINEVRNIENEKIKIIFFESKVDDSVFDNEILNSDFLLAPVKINTSFLGVKEIYGISKETGIHFDSLRYCIPLITEKKLNSPPYLKKGIFCVGDFREQSAEICDFINDNLNSSKNRMEMLNISIQFTPSQMVKNPIYFELT
jgi:hypothetical protein